MGTEELPQASAEEPVDGELAMDDLDAVSGGSLALHTATANSLSSNSLQNNSFAL